MNAANPRTEHIGSLGRRYGMTVDVNRCVGCQTCTIACKHANDTTPDVQWRSVLDVEQGQYPNVQRFFLVVGCQHCADPPCVPVCPTGATAQRDDGLVIMDHDLCIGCAYCAVACPYQARTIVHEDTSYFSSKTQQETQTARPERLGTAQKCTFCIERVDEAESAGKVPGVDLSVTPACAASCIAEAIKFGDFNNPDSEVSQLAKARKTFQINDFLQTDPQIKYLYEVANAIPEGISQSSDDPLAQAPEPAVEGSLAGPRQRFWDYRAAMNIILGGIGSGLIVMTALAAVDGVLAEPAIGLFFVAGGAIIALGLLFVFMEIGRKERFWYALYRPQSSWMTREVWVVIALFPTLGITLLWPATPLYLAAGILGAAFLYCQAQILFACKGIPAWRAPLIPFMVVVSGLAEGAAAAILLSKLIGSGGASTPCVLIAIPLAIGSGVLWQQYTDYAERAGIPKSARDQIRTVFIGVVLAWTIGTLSLVVDLASVTEWAAAAIGAVAILAAGSAWKYTVIVGTSYQQGFHIPRTLGRGSGSYAAPPRLDGFKRAA